MAEHKIKGTIEWKEIGAEKVTSSISRVEQAMRKLSMELSNRVSPAAVQLRKQLAQAGIAVSKTGTFYDKATKAALTYSDAASRIQKANLDKTYDELSKKVSVFDKTASKLAVSSFMSKHGWAVVDDSAKKLTNTISEQSEEAMKVKRRFDMLTKGHKSFGDAIINSGNKVNWLSANFDRLKEAGDRAYQKSCDIQELSKHLHLSIGQLAPTLKEAGIGFNEQNKLINTATNEMIPHQLAIKRLIDHYSSFGGVMSMDRDAFIALRKQGYEFLGTGAKFATWIRLATHGLHGFKMELLSTMFFGMQMQQIGMSMLRPAMKMFGITELFSNVLAVVMLPVLHLIFPYLLGLAKWLMDLGPAGKMVLGFGAMFMVAAGGIIYFGSQLGLFIGAVPKIFAAVSIVKKGAMGMVKALISGGRKMILYASAKLWPRLAGIFGKGMDLLGLGMKTKGRSVTTIFARMGTRLSGTSRMTGMAVGTGMLGPIGMALMGILAAIAIFTVAWSKNWFGIRQKTGAFVVWFSGVYDKWIKPVLFQAGVGIVILKNTFVFVLTNIKNIWSFTWLSIKSAAFKTWNTLLAGVETFVNGMLAPYRILYEKGGDVAKGAAKLFGFGLEMPKFPKFDLSAFKVSTEEVDSELTKVKGSLKSAFTDTAVKTAKDVKWLDGALSGLTETMKVAGEGMIESGNKMDAEREAKEANAESTNKLSEVISNFTGMITGTFTPAVNESTDKINTNTDAIISSGNESLKTIPKINDLTTSINDTSKAARNAAQALNYSFEPALNDQRIALYKVRTALSYTTSWVYSYIRALNRIPRYIHTTVHKEIIVTERRGIFGWGFFGLQHGGIVTRPIVATLAEKGPEAVIPLNRAGGASAPSLGNITVHNTYNISGVSSPDDVEAKIEEANAKLIDDLKAMIR